MSKMEVRIKTAPSAKSSRATPNPDRSSLLTIAHYYSLLLIIAH
ncbi:MAG: hypothetical protein ACR2KW_06465 [Rubrobacter sp.]